MGPRWNSAFAMGVVSLFGLVMASRAVDGVFYVTGLTLFVVGVLYIFYIITKEVGNPPPHEGEHGGS